jgi:DNA-binding PadR family transcriptional regulator
MPKRGSSNPLALAVLSCLLEKPRHPYEISTTLKERGKERSIKLNYGSLYSVVEALEKQGLIEAHETLRDGRRPERTVYRVTPAGEREVETRMTEMLGNPVKDFTQLEAALALAPSLAPDRVIALLEQRAEKLTATLERLQAEADHPTAATLPRLFWIEHEYHRAMVRAERDFVVSLVEDLRSGDFGGLEFWRRSYELKEAGVTFEEGVADLDKYYGEEGSWLKSLKGMGYM